MKKQWVSITLSILCAMAALFLWLTWGASNSAASAASAVATNPLPVWGASARAKPALPDKQGRAQPNPAENTAPSGWVIECADCLHYPCVKLKGVAFWSTI